MTETGYVLDTGVFIQAHRNYYALDLCPGFWEALRHFQGENRLRSIDRVKDEISEGDALADWIKGAPDGFFESTADVSVAKKYAQLMEWPVRVGFTDDARAEFAAVADGWLVAYAAVHGLTVVTHESSEPRRRNKIKVPDACEQFGVESMNTFEMLRQLEITFAWDVR